MTGNRDPETIDGFGDEWSRFDQADLDPDERLKYFQDYFRIFPWETLPEGARGFDLGCGSGRWAQLVAPRVGHLSCLDPASAALEVAKTNLIESSNVSFHLAGVDSMPLDDDSQDFGYSLGVLHHVPDTAAALASCVRKLKPGAPFLVYLYYALDNRPVWFRWVWRSSDRVRRYVAALSPGPRQWTTDLIAASVYYPLARGARWAQRLGIPTQSWPLGYYSEASFYTMRTDARDRFGTQLEQRFTRLEIEKMMTEAGLAEVRFSESAPFWCAVGFRRG
ncbi:MAG: class I SAM-dependent methyltransferase [Myxococcota bacterium]